VIDVEGVSRSKRERGRGKEKERKRKREKEEKRREKPRSIAGNYLAGKRCVNTGHTVFPRLFRVLHLHCLPLLFSVSLYPSPLLSLYGIRARSFRVSSRKLDEFHRPRSVYLVCLLHYVPRYATCGARERSCRRKGNSFDKKVLVPRWIVILTFLLWLAFRNASCNNCLDNFSYFEILHSYFKYFAHIVKVLD